MCTICLNERTIKCFDIECCKECKRAISCRPPDLELLAFVDGVFRKEGVGLATHLKLHRFWHDREGRELDQAVATDSYRRKASLSDFCADVIVRQPDLIVACSAAIPDCSPQWSVLLKGWCRWKRRKARRPTKNARERVLAMYGYR